MMLVSAMRGLVLPVVVAASLVSPALGQTNAVEPYYVATTRAEAPLKSGDMDGYYPVTLLPAGQVLWVDAEGAGWARVAYPPGLSVYVSADEVREEAGGDAVVLTRVSALKSKNMTGGFGASWQRAVPRQDEPAIGTRLEVIRAITDPTGGTIGYEVRPPASARGYVKADALRAATDAEVEAYLATLPAPEDTAPQGGEQDEPADDDAAGGDEAAGDDDAQADPIEVDGGLLEDMTPPGAEDANAVEAPTEGEAQPEDDGAGETDTGEAGSDEGEADGADEPVVIDQGESEQSRLIGTLQQLAELFAEVQRQDVDTAELDELAAEFRRAISAQGDDTVGQRIRESLGQRLALIETRIEARDTRRSLRARREAIDNEYASVASRVRDLERNRGYQFVGRLVRSSVYDGDRLPLMYRMVSVNESVPRTIGYIVPDGEVRVTDKLGEIVGVLGTSTLDRALNLRIVTPTRVDVLTPEGLGLPADAGQPAGAVAEQPES